RRVTGSLRKRRAHGRNCGSARRSQRRSACPAQRGGCRSYTVAQTTSRVGHLELVDSQTCPARRLDSCPRLRQTRSDKVQRTRGEEGLAQDPQFVTGVQKISASAE